MCNSNLYIDSNLNIKIYTNTNSVIYLPFNVESITDDIAIISQGDIIYTMTKIDNEWIVDSLDPLCHEVSIINILSHTNKTLDSINNIIYSQNINHGYNNIILSDFSIDFINRHINKIILKGYINIIRWIIANLDSLNLVSLTDELTLNLLLIKAVKLDNLQVAMFLINEGADDFNNVMSNIRTNQSE